MKFLWAKGLEQEKNVTITFQWKGRLPQKARLRLAASNLYQLLINGELVGYGPARAAHGYTRVDQYDLPAGDICLTVEVYSAQINSFYIIKEPPFFAAEILADGQVLAETSDFTAYLMTERVRKVRRFSFQRTFGESYRLNEDPLVFYSGETKKVPAETVEVAGNQLLERRVPYPTLEFSEAVLLQEGGLIPAETPVVWRDRSCTGVDQVTIEGFRPEELEEDACLEIGRWEGCGQADGTYRLYDFGRTLTGFFCLDLEVKEQSCVYLTFDEVLTDRGTVDPFRNTCGNVIKYVLAPGQYHLMAFEANTARYAAVSVPQGQVQIQRFGLIRYENPEIEAYETHYEDPDLNRITKAAAHTLAQNAVDILMDCPSRERAGWLCDSFFSSRAETLMTGRNAVEQSFLENYALAPQSPHLPQGMIPMCYPSDHNDGVYIPNWAMWYILELRSYLERTGDRSLIDLSRDKVYDLVKFFSRYENEDGLLENLDSWVFIEWSKCNDAENTCGVNFPSNMLWAAALEAAGELYGENAWISQAEAMRRTIRRLAWNGEFFEDNAVRDESGQLKLCGNTTETGQYYAFYFGVAAPESYPELFRLLLKTFGPGRDASTVFPTVYPSNAIVGNYLRLELMVRYGYYEQCLEECKTFFTVMAETTGTLWENSSMYASLNHGFASMAAVYIEVCMKK